MDARLQRRVQRYGWDRAADRYEALWRPQLAPAQGLLLERAQLVCGERVLDVACGTGTVAFAAAQRVGVDGHVLGTDLSGRMVELASVAARGGGNASRVAFARMDGEALDLPDASVDVVLCALGLMYMPDPEAALGEMHRVLRPGGRLAVAVWGERASCAWAAVFGIVDAEVESDVCPLFFRLGGGNALIDACAGAGFVSAVAKRLPATVRHADADEACRAAFVAGPVALAWSRFDDAARERVQRRYLEAISPWHVAGGYRLPAEFLVVDARVA